MFYKIMRIQHLNNAYSNIKKTYEKSNTLNNYANNATGEKMSSVPVSTQIANKNISFSGKNIPLFKLSPDGRDLTIPVKTGKTGTFDLRADRFVTQTYFSDKTGNISREKIQVFKEVFENIYAKESGKHAALTIMLGNFANWTMPDDGEPDEEDIIMSDAEEIISELRQKKEDADETKGILTEELMKPQDEYQFALSLLKRMPEGSFKEKFVSELFKSEVSLPKEAIIQKSYVKTLTFLSLSRKEDTYDISETKEKQKLTDKIIYTENARGEIFLGEKLVSESIKHKGEVDLKYISGLCDILNESDNVSVKPEEIFSAVSEITEKDSEKETEILDFLKNLGKTITPDDENFKEYAKLSFNPVTGKFDEKAAELLPVICSAAEEIADETLSEIKNEREWQNAYFKGERFKLETTRQYFEEIRDEKTGEIKPDAKSAEDFCKNIEF